ncbi:MAG: efflux RND transporter periplasmic adaptor subunit [Acetatifactor muris]|nr:efflux RND transporter periplasmic adaptor subunit [Acetatifactor muris]
MKLKEPELKEPAGKEKGKKGLSAKAPKKKRLVICLVILAVFLLVIVAAVLYMVIRKKRDGDFPFGNMPGNGMQFSVSEGMITASGVTSVGITEESFEVENLTTGLKIEEVYINSEDVITEGTKVLKLSEESIAEAREELEQTLKEADLAYRAGTIEYEQSKITAEYELESKKLSGKQAKEIYDETISGLQDSVDKAREELDQAREDISEYQSYVNDNTYRDYFKVDEYQAAYDETLRALMDKMDEWGVSWPQVTGQGGGMGGTGTSLPENVTGGSTDMPGVVPTSEEVDGEITGPSSDQIQVLSSMYKVLEKQLQKLEQATSDYEDALVNASFELQTLQLKLPDLEKAVTEAEKNYQSQVLQAKLTYETSLANAESAESDYETAIQQAESDFEALKKDLKDAEQNLEVFENSVGDGYFYASSNGTILRTMVRAGQNLTSESLIFLYSNPEEMTVTVSVDQAGIASIALEDNVYIQSSEYGGFTGTVTEINPVSNSNSRTNVTYSVTVRLSGDTTEIPANASVTVIFGIQGSDGGRDNDKDEKERK